jgi:hypothetical protein
MLHPFSGQLDGTDFGGIKCTAKYTDFLTVSSRTSPDGIGHSINKKALNYRALRILLDVTGGIFGRDGRI